MSRLSYWTVVVGPCVTSAGLYGLRGADSPDTATAGRTDTAAVSAVPEAEVVGHPDTADPFVEEAFVEEVASASAAEDCDDGADNDGDGLTDCADADCVHRYVCYEACSGGTDEDLDGLVDCADSECWSTLPCLQKRGIRARVLGGHASGRVHRTSGGVYSVSNIDFSGTATGVYGTVAFLASPATDWSSTSMIQTCTWSVDTAKLRGGRDGSVWSESSSVRETKRTNMVLESGCALGRSDFLPDAIGFDGSAFPVASNWETWRGRHGYGFGLPWYTGTQTGSTASEYSTFWGSASSSSVSGTVYHHQIKSVEIEIGAGSVYTFVPTKASWVAP